ncbi:MAG: MtrB/PioB family decaheme-associated outer membrane protein [Methylococcaceae bacterium]|nr:MtrB/PioB family decaheme-associated outer membrane protein [Methylococcaceae bacterium]
MKTHNEKKNVRFLTLAVQCVFIASVALPLGAHAEEDELYGLTHPANTVDFGALYVSQKSAKFGEYNGLNDQGFYGLGSFDIRGGKGYDSKDSGLRWKLNGANIGTTSRSFGASISDQGKWKLNLGYDELQHNITDTFQTPQQGKTGGNNFTLPANFGSINAANGQPSARELTPEQLNAFHTEKEYTTRRNASLGTTYSITEQLSAQVDYNHLEQSGAKLIGTGSQGGISLDGGSTGRAEAVNIIMNPTNYSTDNLNAALNWVGDKAHLTGGYYASFFHDDYNSLSWQNALASGASGCTGVNCFVNNTMSTAPTNSLHQANLSGGYDFTPTTKLTGGFSYGYNTQNESFPPSQIPQVNGNTPNPFDMMQPGGLPTSQLNGHVETTHGDVKLTDQSIKDLTLSAGFKYNERDNRTDSNAYNYFNLGGVGVDNQYTGVNTPYSNSRTQYEVAAAYRLTKAQNLRLAYEREDIKRWCNGVVGGAQCVASPGSDEDKVSLTYRLKAFEAVNFNAGYSFANRHANFDHNYQANTGDYGVAELNSQNKIGFVAYPYASRDRNLVKTGINWQITQKLDLGVNGHFSYDDYLASLGVQNGRSAGVNVDASYNYQENSSVSAYWSWQKGERNLRSGNNGSPTEVSTNIWTNRLEDYSNTVGLLTRHGGLLAGKLEIIGDLSYARDTSEYSTKLFYVPTVSNTPTACDSPIALLCGNLSPIRNELISLKLTGNYKVHKNGKIAVAYIYQKLNSNDYFYNGQQFGYTPNRVMPNGLQEQDYTVNAVALSYNLVF